MADKERLRKAILNAVVKSNDALRVMGTLGRYNANGSITYRVRGRRNRLYVKLRTSEGAQLTVIARDDLGVPRARDLPVELKFETRPYGVSEYVIVAQPNRDDLADQPERPASGLPPHTHDDRYFRETEFIAASVGAPDAGKPVKTNAGGEIDPTLLAGSTVTSVNTQTGDVVLDADDIDDSATTNKFATAAELTKLAGIAAGANLYVHPNHSGDVTSSGDGATTIANSVVTNAKLADMAEATVKGRAAGAGTGAATNLSASQIRTIANVADGADVTGTAITALATKATPVDADAVVITDSAAADVPKRTLWSNIKSTLAAYFDALYVALTGDQSVAGLKNFTTGIRATQIGIGTDPVTNVELMVTAPTGDNANLITQGDGAQAIIYARARRNAQFQSVIAGLGARGTVATPAASQNNDIPFQFLAYCDPDGSGSFINIAGINFEVAGTPATGSSPGRIVFAVVPVGSVTRQDALTVQQNRRVDLARFLTHTGQRHLASDFSKTNSTLATITGLSVTVEAGRTYTFEAELWVDAHATGGHKYCVAGTATATSIIYEIISWNESTPALAIFSRQTALGGAGVGQAGATAVFTRITGTIVVNAAGTLLLQFAQNVTNASASVVKALSKFVVEEKL